jgi:hypothetical protein
MALFTSKGISVIIICFIAGIAVLVAIILFLQNKKNIKKGEN